MGEPTGKSWGVINRGGMGFDVDGPPRGLRGMFESEADATKAAAAPEMLEALEMVAKYDRGNWMDRPWSRAVAKAIAKAKGQE